MPPAKSRYSRPSASQTSAPCARATERGRRDAARDVLLPLPGRPRPRCVPATTRRGDCITARSACGHRALSLRRNGDLLDHPALVGGEWTATGEWIDVASPYSGETVGRVAKCGAAEARRALDAAAAALAEPLPAHRRAEILDAVAAALDARRDEAARDHLRRGRQAAEDRARRGRARGLDLPLRRRRGAARSPARWCRWTPRAAGAGKLGFTIRVPIGVVARDQPVQLPAQPGRAQDRSGARRRLPGRAQAGVGDAALGALPRRARAGRGPAARLAERGRRAVVGDRRRAGRGRARQADHVHRLGRGGLGDRRASRAQAGQARARELDAADRRRRAPTSTPPPPRSPRTRSRSRARAASRSSASMRSPASTTSSRARVVERVEALAVGDPADPATDVGPLISEAERDRVLDWIARVAAARCSPAAS